MVVDLIIEFFGVILFIGKVIVEVNLCVFVCCGDMIILLVLICF